MVGYILHRLTNEIASLCKMVNNHPIFPHAICINTPSVGAQICFRKTTQTTQMTYAKPSVLSAIKLKEVFFLYLSLWQLITYGYLLSISDVRGQGLFSAHFTDHWFHSAVQKFWSRENIFCCSAVSKILIT